MPTFGELREGVIRRSDVKNHFDFIALSAAHADFWDKMNKLEFRRGYKQEEYEKPGSLALWQMDLLTREEFASWMRDFEALPKRKSD